jgi:ABC-type sugar transport system permease subunit
MSNSHLSQGDSEYAVMRFVFALLITILSLFYFLPFAIAFYKKRINTGAIFALNLFLGWSLIGWVIALVWALKAEHTL